MKLLNEEECRTGVGLPFDIQQKLRSGDFAFITEMGRQLQLDEQVLCTGNWMVNLFFIRRSYLNYDRHVVSTAALMLSCKLHNFKRQGKRVYPISFASTYHKIINNKQSTPQRQPLDDALKTEYLNKFFKAEFKLLKTLEFDLDIDLPTNYLDEIISKLYMDEKGEDREVFLSMARVMANESMRSIAPLCVNTLGVAVACVVLAAVVCNKPRPHELESIQNPDFWWLTVSSELTLEEITQAVRLINEAITIK